jgi:hypothetical protein
VTRFHEIWKERLVAVERLWIVVCVTGTLVLAIVDAAKGF